MKALDPTERQMGGALKPHTSVATVRGTEEGLWGVSMSEALGSRIVGVMEWRTIPQSQFAFEGNL